MKKDELERRNVQRNSVSKSRKVYSYPCLSDCSPHKEPPLFPGERVESICISSSTRSTGDSHKSGNNPSRTGKIHHRVAEYTPTTNPPKPPKK